MSLERMLAALQHDLTWDCFSRCLGWLLDEQTCKTVEHTLDVVVDHFRRLVAAISASVMDGILIAPAGASQSTSEAILAGKNCQRILRKT